MGMLADPARRAEAHRAGVAGASRGAVVSITPTESIRCKVSHPILPNSKRAEAALLRHPRPIPDDRVRLAEQSRAEEAGKTGG